MKFNQGGMTTFQCRTDQHDACRGYDWPAGADLPYACECAYCVHHDPSMILTHRAELLGDAIRHERNDDA